MSTMYYSEKGKKVFSKETPYSIGFYDFLEGCRINFITRDNKIAFLYTAFADENFYSVFVKGGK